MSKPFAVSCHSTGGRRFRLPAVAALVLFAAPVAAFTVEHRAARYADHIYECELTVLLEAPLPRVEAVLRDYAGYPQLDARILHARVLERPAVNIVVLETELRACVGPLCRNVSRIERVEEAPGSLIAMTDASRSEVRFGETRTQLEAIDADTTRVTYHTRITPDRWASWFTRRRWMLQTLEEATTSLFENVERKAREP